MSRSGYTDDMEDMWAHIRWRGAVASAINGARGQKMLRELLAALDAMPEKRLVANELHADGEFCALGVLGQQRGIDLDALDPEDRDAVAEAFGVAPALVAEIVYENDESIDSERPVYVEICGPVRPHYPDWGRLQRTVWEPNIRAGEQRWGHMRAWVAAHIKDEA
jgi:hypothetical protein